MVGHQKQWQFLKHSLKRGLSHAYLFYGQDQLGKKTLALKFAKLLNCEATPEQKPCNNCRSCKEIEQSRHPDLSIIEPDQGQIKIGQIRSLIQKLSRKPYRAPFKIAIVDEAHLISQEAESALLKTVEEPKGNTVLILITSQKENLAPTLTSRTQSIEFYPVSSSKIKQFLIKEGLSEQKANQIAKISLGRPGLAKKLARPENFEQYQNKINHFKKLTKANLSFRFQYSEQLAKDGGLEPSLDIWLNWLRRVMLKKIEQPNSESADFSALDYSLDETKRILNTIQQTKFLITTTNINRRLALEMLMLEL